VQGFWLYNAVLRSGWMGYRALDMPMLEETSERPVQLRRAALSDLGSEPSALFGANRSSSTSSENVGGQTGDSSVEQHWPTSHS
jgi:hypothetical protein